MSIYSHPKERPAHAMTRQSIHEQWRVPLLLGALLCLIAALAWTWGSASVQRTVTGLLIQIIIVVGMQIFIGHSGVLSFGHMAFVGIGAYSAAWTSMDPAIKQYVLTGLPEFLKTAALPWFPSVVIGSVLAGIVGLIVGSVILRLSGIAASIATFSLLAIFNVVYSNWDSVTAGSSSIVGIPTPVGVPQALGVALLVLLLAQWHVRTRFGLALRAVREEPIAAASCGVHAWQALLVAFTLSAVVCGIGGAMDAQFVGVVNPDAYYLSRTFTALAMLVIGGAASLTGAITGVLVISTLIEVLVRLEAGVPLGGVTLAIPAGSQEIVIGVLMIVMLIKRPRGLISGGFSPRCLVGKKSP